LTHLAISTCTQEEKVKETTESNNKEVKAETVNGETTVTVTTTKDGKEEIKVLTGAEAEEYILENDLENMEHPEGTEVIIKKMESNSSINFDVEEILNDPELKGIDEETKAKIKKALDNAMKDVELDIDQTSDTKIKTKVVVIED